MVAAMAIVFVFYLKGPDHKELNNEWFQYSNGLLKSKLTQLIQQSKYDKYPSLIDHDSNTKLVYKFYGDGTSYHNRIDRDGNWWIQHSPSSNGKLSNEIVFKQSGGYQLDNNLNFSKITDLFEKNLHIAFDEEDYIDYFRYADSLRMAFMIENKLLWSDSKGMHFAFVEYVTNSKPSSWQWIHENGNIMVKGIYENGKRENEWNWYFSNGSLALTEYYNIGILNGTSVYYSLKGEILKKIPYENGKLNGIRKYYKDNKKVLEEHYLNGKKGGNWKEWYVSGIKKTEGKYSNNEKSGIWKEWYENGILKAKGNYEKDKRIGDWSYWNSDGSLDDLFGIWDATQKGEYATLDIIEVAFDPDGSGSARDKYGNSFTFSWERDNKNLTFTVWRYNPLKGEYEVKRKYETRNYQRKKNIKVQFEDYYPKSWNEKSYKSGLQILVKRGKK